MGATDREHEEQQRRHVAAHERAAAVHDRAVKLHSDATEFFTEHGRPVQAARERELADREAGKAEAAHRAAVTPGEDRSLDPQDEDP